MRLGRLPPRSGQAAPRLDERFCIGLEPCPPSWIIERAQSFCQGYGRLPLPPDMTDLPRDRPAAFTLIELLIVITIIGVLASLLLGVISKVRERADRTTCLNNLHQIGIASLQYEADHNGIMPGPTDAGLKVYYTTNMLCGVLAPYLGLPSTPNNLIVPIFRCPTWQRVAQQPTKSSDNIICYVTDNRISLTNGSHVDPIGYPNETPPDLPKPAAQIAALEGQQLQTKNTTCGATSTFSMTATMYITECDQTNWAFDSSAGWYGALPKTPVHGNIRNTLFFDMHAEARPATLIP
jgi:prepilin-type N-terminal cleavage/methylation domain-containing protein